MIWSVLKVEKENCRASNSKSDDGKKTFKFFERMKTPCSFR